MKRPNIPFILTGIFTLILILFQNGCVVEDTNLSPDPPYNPVPEDGATNVPIDQNLSWQCSDPNGDILTYKVYFGETSPPPRVGSDQLDSTYDPGSLDHQKTYFWQIKANDPDFFGSISPIWSFTTIGTGENQPPSVPSDPIPVNNAMDVPLNVTLQWSCTDPDADPITFDVYFGQNNPPSLVDTGNILNNYMADGLNTNTMYYWKIVASDDHGHSTEGPVWNFTTQTGGGGIACDGVSTVEWGGQTYHTVEIGPQCWLKENLNIGTMLPGNQGQTDNEVIEKYCYDDDPANCQTYGGLYQWEELMDYVFEERSQGICPDGWHVPFQGDWFDLVIDIGGPEVAGRKMKEEGTAHWNDPNDATNESGLTAFGAGLREENGSFSDLKIATHFGSSTEFDQLTAWYVGLIFESPAVFQNYFAKTSGVPVRCIKNGRGE